uniref:Uncharacterized protein n=1 Tax=Bigelowiella natans TaxID=227086 RepID=A0A7S2KI79_BIGNA|mmetsp:Transcript_1663/g.2497  ORF Transcript_1663/g.2497 Transcript_1663/m.2497 type:complete len:127 (+) Transcript_1663:169-549(+)
MSNTFDHSSQKFCGWHSRAPTDTFKEFDKQTKGLITVVASSSLRKKSVPQTRASFKVSLSSLSLHKNSISSLWRRECQLYVCTCVLFCVKPDIWRADVPHSDFRDKDSVHQHLREEEYSTPIVSSR